MQIKLLIQTPTDDSTWVAIMPVDDWDAQREDVHEFFEEYVCRALFEVEAREKQDAADSVEDTNPEGGC